MQIAVTAYCFAVVARCLVVGSRALKPVIPLLTCRVVDSLFGPRAVLAAIAYLVQAGCS